VIHYQPKEGRSIDFVIKYDPKQWKASIEKVPLTTEEDVGIRTKWGDTIHRINFAAISPKTKDTCRFEVKKK